MRIIMQEKNKENTPLKRPPVALRGGGGVGGFGKG